MKALFLHAHSRFTEFLRPIRRVFGQILPAPSAAYEMTAVLRLLALWTLFVSGLALQRAEGQLIGGSVVLFQPDFGNHAATILDQGLGHWTHQGTIGASSPSNPFPLSLQGSIDAFSNDGNLNIRCRLTFNSVSPATTWSPGYYGEGGSPYYPARLTSGFVPLVFLTNPPSFPGSQMAFNSSAGVPGTRSGFCQLSFTGIQSADGNGNTVIELRVQSRVFDRGPQTGGAQTLFATGLIFPGLPQGTLYTLEVWSEVDDSPVGGTQGRPILP